VSEPAVLVGDLGSTRLRLALFGLDGRPRVQVHGAAGGASPPWPVFEATLASLLEQPGGRDLRVLAVVLAAVARTQVFVDAAGDETRPAIGALDARARAEADALRAAMEAEGLVDATARHSPPGVHHPLARVLWVARHEPDVLARTRWVLTPKDYLNLRLTGVAATDVPQAGLYADGRTLDLPRPLLRRLGLDPGLFPPSRWPEVPVGHVRPGLGGALARLAGVPVLAGSMDAWCAALGLGAVAPGSAYVVSGTSDALGVVAPAGLTAPGLTSLPWAPGLTHLGGAVQSGGDCLAWLAEMAGEFAAAVAGPPPPAPTPGSEPPAAGAGARRRPDLAALVDRLARAPRPASVPLFLPYLAGERVPLWDAEVRGAFVGLDRTHGAAHLLWAVLEGVALADRHGLEAAFAAAALAPAAVRLGGGAARLDGWCQVRADVLGRAVLRTAEPEAGLLGAALVAYRGLGRVRDWAEAQARFVRVARRFEPDPRAAARYERLFAAYRDAAAWAPAASRAVARAAGPP
jgi:xylulokinase